MFASLAAGSIGTATCIRYFTATDTSNLSHVIKLEFIAIYAATFPAAVIGLAIGFETYQLISGSRSSKEIRWWVWPLAFAVIGLWVLPFYLAYARRKRFLLLRKQPGWLAPGLYLALILSVSLATANKMDFPIGLTVCPIISLFLSDCLLVNAIVRYKIQDRLGTPGNRNFQFSLGSLMLAVLCLGGYVTGLVLIFGK